ncbi:hypothetical protein [Pseudonocardia spinosispora]|uniref:hypothetical protein n=1 Tax=Pseudonocardia spinosispora TaxID=103441 RepID=UPI00041AB59B|nr:hypothetical protein [Pseudonocardia spinosispora]
MPQLCAACTAPLSYLVGDATPYELIDPLEGGPKALVPHTDERCRFHRFLTPELGPPLSQKTKPEMITPRPSIRLERWVRTD